MRSDTEVSICVSGHIRPHPRRGWLLSTTVYSSVVPGSQNFYTPCREHFLTSGKEVWRNPPEPSAKPKFVGDLSKTATSDLSRCGQIAAKLSSASRAILRNSLRKTVKHTILRIQGRRYQPPRHQSWHLGDSNPQPQILRSHNLPLS